MMKDQRIKWVWIFPLFLTWCSALSCWKASSIQDLPTLQKCPSHMPSCVGVYHVNALGEVNLNRFGCIQIMCHATRCEPQRASHGTLSCCCNHDGCNAIKGLSRYCNHSPQPPLSPIVTPPTPLPGQIICEVYNCSMDGEGGNCFHGYQNCNGSCAASYLRDERGNYGVETLQCLRNSSRVHVAPPDSCFLDTSASINVIQCTCGRSVCNSIPAITFSNPKVVIDYVDRDCKKLRCSHICVRTADGVPICLCHHGFMLAQDGTTCVNGAETPSPPEILQTETPSPPEVTSCYSCNSGLLQRCQLKKGWSCYSSIRRIKGGGLRVKKGCKFSCWTQHRNRMVQKCCRSHLCNGHVLSEASLTTFFVYTTFSTTAVPTTPPQTVCTVLTTPPQTAEAELATTPWTKNTALTMPLQTKNTALTTSHQAEAELTTPLQTKNIALTTSHQAEAELTMPPQTKNTALTAFPQAVTIKGLPFQCKTTSSEGAPSSGYSSASGDQLAIGVILVAVTLCK